MGDDEDNADTHDGSAISERTMSEITRQLKVSLAPGLYIVATPIGHLADMTLRAIATLASADIVYCEDTRTSRTLLNHYGIRTKLRPYHEHNAEDERPRVLAELAQDRVVALISDAGTPLVSDPGFKLVRDAAAAGHTVIAIPGPSAALAALTVAGLPTDAFFFAGFLPHKEGARKARITELATIPGTLLFFESPTRTAAALADLAEVLGDRDAVLARELTKLYEEIRRAPLSELARGATTQPPKGEIVIAVAPPGRAEVTDEEIEASLSAALGSFSVRDASKVVAERLKVPKARVYDIALGLKRHDTR